MVSFKHLDLRPADNVHILDWTDIEVKIEELRTTNPIARLCEFMVATAQPGKLVDTGDLLLHIPITGHCIFVLPLRLRDEKQLFPDFRVFSE